MLAWKPRTPTPIGLRRRQAWMWMGLLLAVLPVPAGAEDGFVAEQTLSQTFDASITPRVVVETFNGNVDVTAGAGRTVTAEVTRHGSGATPAEAEADLDAVTVTTSQEANTVRIIARRTDAQPREQTGAAVRLTVPARATVDAVTRNGSVVLSGVNGGARVVSSNGSIDVTGGRGRLTLQTSNGPIRIEARDAIVSASTTSGGIAFAGTMAVGDHFFRTLNGPIDITLPADTRFKINASSWNGRVSSAFRVARTGGTSDMVLNGTVGDNPAVSIKAEAINGNIALHRGQ